MDEERRGLVKKQSPVGNKLQLTVDEVVEEYVGSFGFSQLLQVFLVSLAWIFDAHSTLVTIFTDAQPESWRCIAPDCGGTSGQSGGGGGDASVCRLKPGTWEWSDGNASSIIAEWGLVCDRRFLAALPASVYFLGSLIGSAVFGCLADAFLGRKRSVLLSCLLTSATIFLTSLSPNIWIYALLRFANGFPGRHWHMLPCPLHRSCWPEMAWPSRPIRVFLLCSRVPFNSLDCLSNQNLLEKLIQDYLIYPSCLLNLYTCTLCIRVPKVASSQRSK
ncbi:UNVERIFIED_CONTAM: Organic cation/carnitine transporter 1 [Sesamum calycinum]|uniref:Organic cation/carnitine transporter 1 n=1 Tax=Sesamum calycinum TaxID=2727403 RepID=A0AAW2NDW8_9LAMI